MPIGSVKPNIRFQGIRVIEMTDVPNYWKAHTTEERKSLREEADRADIVFDKEVSQYIKQQQDLHKAESDYWIRALPLRKEPAYNLYQNKVLVVDGPDAASFFKDVFRLTQTYLARLVQQKRDVEATGKEYYYLDFPAIAATAATPPTESEHRLNENELAREFSRDHIGYVRDMAETHVISQYADKAQEKITLSWPDLKQKQTS